MAAKIKAKVFTHGGSQAVRLPKAFRFDEEEVNVRREGKAAILEPARQGGAELWTRIAALRGDEQMEYVAQPHLGDSDKDLAW